MYFDIVINMSKSCVKYRGISFYFVSYQLNKKKTYNRPRFKPERRQFRIRYELPDNVPKVFLDTFHLIVNKSFWKREVYDFECELDIKDKSLIVLNIEEKDAELVIQSGSKKSRHDRKIYPEAEETEIRVGCCCYL